MSRDRQRVLVTGSSQGIGLAVARAFLTAGARVILTSERSLDLCPEAAELLRAPDTHYIQADLLRDGEIERLFAEARLHWGGLDVLVNNVGTFREPAFCDLTRKDFDFIFGLNVWTGLLLCREFARFGLETGTGGRILFTTSLNAERSEPGHTLYDAAKGAVNALVRQLAIELAPLGFTTIGIAPGLIETPLTDFGLRSTPAARRAIEEQIPLRRIGTPADVAAWYVFLASPAAHYATGTIVTIDGGLAAQQMPTRPVTAAERGEPDQARS